MIYPARYNLPHLILGYDWDFSFTYEVSGVAVDFTGYSMSLKVMDSYDSAVLDTWSSGDGDITLGDDGSVAIVIASDDQSNLSIGTKKYIVELTDPDSDVSLIMTGDWPIVDINGA
ncbi:MAG: hypothetical protein PHG80_12065 [Methanoregulaceae archaeon]|nr:hypothetical protein [Methanoregulaceae archaeon]